MALYVQKYGGTSVGSIDRIEAVADKLQGFKEQGHELRFVALNVTNLEKTKVTSPKGAGTRFFFIFFMIPRVWGLRLTGLAGCVGLRRESVDFPNI